MSLDAYTEGFEAGKKEGLLEGHEEAYREGYSDGEDDGYSSAEHEVKYKLMHEIIQDIEAYGNVPVALENEQTEIVRRACAQLVEIIEGMYEWEW